MTCMPAEEAPATASPAQDAEVVAQAAFERGAVELDPDGSVAKRPRTVRTAPMGSRSKLRAQLEQLARSDVWPQVRPHFDGKSIDAGSIFSGSACPSVWSSMVTEEFAGVDNVTFRFSWKWHCDSDSTVAQPWLLKTTPEHVNIFNRCEELRYGRAKCLRKGRVRVKPVHALVAAMECSGFSTLASTSSDNPLDAAAPANSTRNNWSALKDFVSSRGTGERPKIIIQETLVRCDKGEIFKNPEDQGIVSQILSAYGTMFRFYTEAGYAPLCDHVAAMSSGDCTSRRRAHYSWHDVILNGAPLCRSLFTSLMEAQHLEAPDIREYITSPAAYRACPWKQQWEPRRASTIVKDERRARDAFIESGDGWPPKLDFSSPLTWGLPANGYVDVDGFNSRELHLTFWQRTSYKSLAEPC